MKQRNLPAPPEFNLPGTPGLDQVHSVVTSMVKNENNLPVQSRMSYGSLGNAQLFEPLIPPPTVPPPTPTAPPPPPDIDLVTQHWQLSFVGKTFASFINTKDNKDWNMKRGEAYEVIYRGKPVSVYLKEMSQKTWSATVTVTENGQEQTRVLKMF